MKARSWASTAVRLALVGAAGLAATGCFDFDGALDACRQPSRCINDSVTIAFAPGANTLQVGDPTRGTSYEDSCPVGQVVVGYAGFAVPGGADLVNGALQALCGTANVTGTGPYSITIASGDRLALRGTSSAAAWTATCPPNQVIVGYVARSGSSVDQLVFRCTPLLSNDAPGPFALHIGGITELAPVGGTGGGVSPTTDCPIGQLATMTRVAAGSQLYAFGLGCSTYSLQE